MSEKPAALTQPPEGYADWLAELKNRIHTARQRATLAVNRELVLLYWQIGRDILSRQAKQGWGAKVIDRLAHDLRTAFPEMKGFPPETSNICGPLPRHGRSRNLCRRCLHNCLGIITLHCSINSSLRLYWDEREIQPTSR